MNLAEFKVIAKLISSREPVKTAAMLVLVEGKKGVDAAEMVGASPQSVSNAVMRIRNADAEIKRAYNIKK